MGAITSRCHGRRRMDNESLNIGVSTIVKEKVKLKYKCCLKKYKKVPGSDGLLGSGGFADVRKAHDETGNPVAIKSLIELDGMTKRQVLLTLREVSVLKVCEHDNIIKFIDCYSNSNLTSVHFIMEMMDTTLDKYVLQVELTHNVIKRISYEFMLGLSYLNKSKIIHRDIKPKNLGIKRDQLKILDFGCARLIDHNNRMTYEIGSLAYTAPEVLIGEKYTENIDVWSFGAVLAAVVTDTSTWFTGINLETQLDQIFDARGKPPVSFGKQIKQFRGSKKWKRCNGKLIDDLFPDEMLVKMILSDTTDKERLKDFLDQLLTLDPALRDNASCMMEHAYLTTSYKTNLDDLKVVAVENYSEEDSDNPRKLLNMFA